VERAERGAEGRAFGLRHLYLERPDLAAARQKTASIPCYNIGRRTNECKRSSTYFAQLLNLTVSRRETAQQVGVGGRAHVHLAPQLAQLGGT
jgi:hypothetical protein